MKKQLHLIIQGRVQGVCFRMYTCEQAEHLGLTGWVRNMSDGSVEVLAEGQPKALADLALWCRRGPSHAMVTGVAEEYSDATGKFNDFVIAY